MPKPSQIPKDLKGKQKQHELVKPGKKATNRLSRSHSPAPSQGGESEASEGVDGRNAIDVDEEDEEAPTSAQPTRTQPEQSSSQGLRPSPSLKDFLRPGGNVEKQAQDCILSYNTLSVSNPPADMVFGTYNPRPLQSSAVTRLARAFAHDTFTPFSPQCVFPIVMYKEDLIDACINPTPSFVGTAPVLQVAGHVKELFMCGGHHRVNAVVKAREQLTATVAECSRVISKKTEAGEDDDDDEDDDEEQLNPHTQLDLDRARARLDMLDTWGCVIYDKAMIDKAPHVGMYLSQNKEEVKLKADGAENLNHELQMFKQKLTERDLQNYIHVLNQRDHTGTSLVPIVRETHVRNALVRMLKFHDAIYRMSPPMAPEWITKHLINIYGGMLSEVINYNLDILEFCFSPQAPEEFETSQTEPYFLHCADRDASKSQKYEEVAVSTWSLVTTRVQEFYPTILDEDFWKARDARHGEIFGSLVQVMFHVGENEYSKALAQYIKDTLKEHQTALTKARPREQAPRTAKRVLLDKLRWCFFDHGQYHYAPVMPLLSPSIVDCLAQVFETIPRSLQEFCSWVYPMADIDVRRAKAHSDSRDISAVVIGAIKSNRCKMFMVQSVDDVVRTFALFPLKNIGVFQKLEQDMAQIEPATLIRSSKMDTTAFRQMGMTEKEYKDEIGILKDWMRAHRESPTQMWHSTVWPLNVEGKFVWRGDGVKGSKVKKASKKDKEDANNSKNVDRDFKVNAGFSLNEQRVAMKYRPQLLATSAAARWIRQEFTEAMTPFVSSWKRKIDGEEKNETRYVFPDMLKHTDETVVPIVDIKEFAKAQATGEIEDKSLKSFAKEIERIQRFKYLQASPSGSVMDDNVRNALDILAKAGRANIKRHARMQADVNAGEALDDITPQNPKYAVAQPSSDQLTFYKRVEGWTEHSTSQASHTHNSDHLLDRIQVQQGKSTTATRSSKRIATGKAATGKGASKDSLMTAARVKSAGIVEICSLSVVLTADCSRYHVSCTELVIDSDEAQPSAAVSNVVQPSGTSERNPPAASAPAPPVTSTPIPPVTFAPVPPVASVLAPPVHQPASISHTVKAPPAASTSRGHPLPPSGPSQPPPPVPPVAPMDVDSSSPSCPVSPLMAPFESLSHGSARVSDSDDDDEVSVIHPPPKASTSLKRNKPQDARSPESAGPLSNKRKMLGNKRGKNKNHRGDGV